MVHFHFPPQNPAHPPIFYTSARIAFQVSGQNNFSKCCSAAALLDLARRLDADQEPVHSSWLMTKGCKAHNLEVVGSFPTGAIFFSQLPIRPAERAANATIQYESTFAQETRYCGNRPVYRGDRLVGYSRKLCEKAPETT
jgi:hypothetical protein